MKIRARAAKFSSERVSAFELLYRRARNDTEQDQVTKAFDDAIDGWKRSTDGLALVRRGFLDDMDDDDEELPILCVKP